MAKKFGGFTDPQKEILARKMGFKGPMDQFGSFLQSDPANQAKFLSYEDKASKMLMGGAPQQKPRPAFSSGGSVTVSSLSSAPGTALTQKAIDDPNSLVTQTQATPITTSQNQFVDNTVGQVAKSPDLNAATVSPTAQAANQATTPANTVTTATSASDVASATEDMKAAKGEVSQDAQSQAQTKDPSTMSALELRAYQLEEAQKVQTPAKRQLDSGEIISGSNVDMEEVNRLTDIQAAQADPSAAATVQGQLTNLMQQFEGGETPSWAAGAMRAATATMAARGLGASSIAGMAVVQAAMESALPIAMADAQTNAGFQLQNLTNRQQAVMLGAEQRAQFLGQKFDQEFQAKVLNANKISEIANLNFTAEQQVALENARLAQSVDLANLDARNAKMMADAAAMSQMDLTNLNNRQQSAVQNAQSFLQMDMANLDTEQQNTMFKNQSIVQSLFTDRAAENASAQFNATSQNQTDQFFSNLSSQVSQFNAAQANAMEQFKAGQKDSVGMFNRQMNDATNQFNAQNRLVIDQSNAEWRRAVTTANNATQNEANRLNAQAATGMTLSGYNNLMQRERDLYSFAYQSSENAADRAANLAMNKMNVRASNSQALGTALGSLAGAAIGAIWE